MESDGVRYVANGNGNGYSAGLLLDQQLEKEMNSAYQNSCLLSFIRWLTFVSYIIDAISHLPTADDEKYAMNKNQLSSKVSRNEVITIGSA